MGNRATRLAGLRLGSFKVVTAAVASLAGLIGVRPAAFAAASVPSVSMSAPASLELATYHGNLGRTGYDPTETTITAANASTLEPLWTYKATGTISGQPAVVDGVAYWGDWSGNEHATTATGKNLWTTFLGQTSHVSCDPSPVGIASSATVGTLNGHTVVVTGGGQGTVAELNAADGKIIWNTRIAPRGTGFVWSSPALYNGSVYIGMSSFGDCPLVPGAMFMLNAATGAVEHQFVTVPAGGCLGAGIWSSPAIDPSESAVFVSTGNASCDDPLQNAILKLSASNLTIEGSWAVPASQYVNDSDWGSTPTLFTAEIGGSLVQLVGSADKNGIFYALTAAHPGRGPIWEFQVAEGGDCPQCGDGSISPATWDGTSLYVAGGTTVVGSQTCKGSIDALDPATGQPLWRDCLQGGPVLGALTGVPGLVFATEGADIIAVEAHNGARRFFSADPDSSVYYGPPTVSDGVVYAGNTDDNLFTWDLPEVAGHAAPHPVPRPADRPFATVHGQAHPSSRFAGS